MTPPGPPASGRDADVFAPDARPAVRRNRDGRSPAAGAAVMAHVTGHGFAAPRAHAVDGADLAVEEEAVPAGAPPQPSGWAARKSRTSRVALGSSSCR